MSRRSVVPLLLLMACSFGRESEEVPSVAGSAAPPPIATTEAATPSIEPAVSAEASATSGAVATLIAAGDIAGCDVEGDSATAALVAKLDGMVAVLGDSVYPAGSDETFAACYDPVWGAFLERTHPAVGNHDLSGDGGAAYYRYFGDRAGIAGEGWYSYELGEWHVVVLNSNCELILCGPGTPQHDWLTHGLAASDALCTVAYMHHPRFSSGPHGDYPPVGPIWEALYAHGVDLVLAGHDHLYERFAPQTPAGAADPAGIRQITAGTGGYVLYQADRIAPNSEVLIDDSFGILELTLRPDSYDWSFLTVAGAEADAGTAACH